MIAMKKMTMYLINEGKDIETKSLESMINNCFSSHIDRTRCILIEEETLKVKHKCLGPVRKHQHK